ncbi:hypothetical protein PLESTB_000277400 [Pleodorina starrii]|uniref:Uncharacterized protein n=1 Tax=Pleodorina starrii TaxID=330485 RepID=A0A9W6BDC7_9CHLO|nr:hypothetical protein PLESTB_000277400 [Pleodorina starrii]
MDGQQQQQANLQQQAAGLAAQAANGNNPANNNPAPNPVGPGLAVQQPPAQAAIQPQLLQLAQHQNHAAVIANISFGRDEAMRQRFTELGGQFNATCPASVKFVAGFARDVGSNIYAAWHAAKFLLPSMAELGPVVDAMFMALLQMDLFYASCAAACRCTNHQMEVAEEYYNNNKHMAVNPTAEVKAGTERLFQLNDEWKRRGYRDVKDQFGVDPRSVSGRQGGANYGAQQGAGGRQQGGGGNRGQNRYQPYPPAYQNAPQQQYGQQQYGNQQFGQYGPMMPAQGRGRGRGGNMAPYGVLVPSVDEQLPA